jgi:hypothetical protein
LQYFSTLDSFQTLRLFLKFESLTKSISKLSLKFGKLTILECKNLENLTVLKLSLKFENLTIESGEIFKN